MTAPGEGYRLGIAIVSFVYLTISAIVAHVLLYKRGHLQPLKT